MAIEFRSITVPNQSTTRSAAPQTEAPERRTVPAEARGSVIRGDEASFSVATRKQPTTTEYPTVGEYVKDQFDQKMSGVLSGLHLVAETLPPVLVAEIAGIHAKHKKAALEQIWQLPMDPEGKWKIKAEKIMDAEAAAARAEVRELPLVKAVNNAGQAIASGASWLGGQIEAGVKGLFTGIGNVFKSIGKAITHAGNYVLDGFVSTGVAVGKGVQVVGRGIEDGARATGEAIREAGTTLSRGATQAYQATADGLTWLGDQAVELPRTAAREVARGIGDLGKGMVDFSERTEAYLAP
ncbi:hypothetical protein D3C86_1091950 [compost metagenome]